MRNILAQTLIVCATAGALAFMTGCQSNDHGAAPASAQAAPAMATPPATPSVAPAPAATKAVVRIKAGVTAAFTDSSGNVWQPEQGFEGGDVDCARRGHGDCQHQGRRALSVGTLCDELLFLQLFPTANTLPNFTSPKPLKASAALASAFSPSMSRGTSSRILMFLSRPAVQTAPTSKPCRWKSPMGNSPLLSPATSRIRKSTRLSLCRNPDCARLATIQVGTPRRGVQGQDCTPRTPRRGVPT